MGKLILPPNAIAVWVTEAIEKDYEGRRAFPRLRSGEGLSGNGKGSLHVLEPKEAEEVFEDAERRMAEVYKGLRNAFRVHAGNVRSAIDEAPKRVARFAAETPFERGAPSDYSEHWIGTKEQLQAAGIGVGAAFPGEPGAKRWFKTTDPRGYETRVSPSSWHYPYWALFNAEITYPRSVTAEKQTDREAAAAAASDRQLKLAQLKSLPKTADEFRKKVADEFWIFVRITLLSMAPNVGLRFDEKTIDEFEAVATEAYWILKKGETEGETAAAVMRSRAKADVPLQAFLAKARTLGQAGLGDEASH